MHIVSVPPQDVYQALSDSIRIRLVRLHSAIEHELCLCDLSESLQEPDYKISRHLKVLRSSGLLTATKDGRWIYHTIVSDVPFLKSLYQSVLMLPDEHNIFKSDLARCKKLRSVLQRLRCRGKQTAGTKKSQQRRTFR